MKLTLIIKIYHWCNPVSSSTKYLWFYFYYFLSLLLLHPMAVGCFISIYVIHPFLSFVLFLFAISQTVSPVYTEKRKKYRMRGNNMSRTIGTRHANLMTLQTAVTVRQVFSLFFSHHSPIPQPSKALWTVPIDCSPPSHL